MEEQVQPAAPKTDLSSLNVKDIFFKYVRFLPLLVVSVALCLFAAYIYLRYATETYVSSGTMVLEDLRNRKRSNERFDELFSVGGGDINVPTEIEYIRSRPLVQRVVRSLNLNYTYYAKGRFKDLNVYKIAPYHIEAFKIKDSTAPFSLNIKFENDYGFRLNDAGPLFSFGQVFENPYGIFRLVRHPYGTVSKEYNIIWQPTSHVANGLIGSLGIAPKIPNTSIITMSLETTSPYLSADVINQLMREYQQATIEDKNVTTRQTIKFIDGRLDIVSRERDSITQRLLQYQLANNMINPEAQSGRYFAMSTEAEDNVTSQRIQIDIAGRIADYLNDPGNVFDVVPSSLGIGDATLNTLIAAYNTTQLERRRMVDGRVPRGNVAVQAMEDQLEKLRRNILENLRNLRSSYGSLIKKMQEQNKTFETQLRAFPAKMQNFIEIQRQQQSKQEMYNFLMGKREESAISLAATISDTKVLDEATPNLSPVKPKRRNTQMLAIAIGLGLPALFIFLVEALNDKITSRRDIEKITDATIIGEVGHSYAKHTLMATANNRSVVAEQFRIIRSNLQYTLNHIQKPVILVTSSFSGEGKSFISTNAGSVMALSGKRTIVLEFDIRKPKVLSQLNISKKPGLTNY
jgi:uncharacterized protein involved in exopolysaccharide biosynthesis